MGLRLPAPVQGFGARRALRRERQRADGELLATRLPSPRLAWRIRELVDEENRLSLARSLTDVVRVADERLLPSASPLDRAAARACRAELLALASRMCDLEHRVAPRGILLVDELLVDGSGPLYGHNDPAELRQAIERARVALEGGDGAGA